MVSAYKINGQQRWKHSDSKGSTDQKISDQVQTNTEKSMSDASTKYI